MDQVDKLCCAPTQHLKFNSFFLFFCLFLIVHPVNEMSSFAPGNRWYGSDLLRYMVYRFDSIGYISLIVSDKGNVLQTIPRIFHGIWDSFPPHSLVYQLSRSVSGSVSPKKKKLIFFYYSFIWSSNSFLLYLYIQYFITLKLYIKSKVYLKQLINK